MSTTFFLVQHAIKEKAVGDVPLTPKGVLQAQATAGRFCHLPISAVYSSPLRSARDRRMHCPSDGIGRPRGQPFEGARELGGFARTKL
ncbi:Histidine phosphatase superfamily (branch 1) [Paenibacillus sp. P1XP2]|nr:Histidine phosphatase superfamily (branch 1) [Paenibacillus sp. P1XP2]